MLVSMDFKVIFTENLNFSKFLNQLCNYLYLGRPGFIGEKGEKGERGDIGKPGEGKLIS